MSIRSWVMRGSMGLLGALAFAASASAADVGVSVSIGQPGFYGRIDVGSYPQPVLVYPQPVIVQQAPVAVVRQPVYLHVPPGHAKNWSKHCARYGACNQPVYFVQDDWYQRVYVPQYREQHGHRGHPPGRYDDRDHGRGRGRGHDKHKDRDHDHH